MFGVYQATDVIAGGVCTWLLFTMLGDANAEVVGDTYIEVAGTAAEDVDVEAVFARWHSRDSSPCVGEADSSATLRNDNQKGKCCIQAEVVTIPGPCAGEADSFAALRNDNQKTGAVIALDW